MMTHRWALILGLGLGLAACKKDQDNDGFKDDVDCDDHDDRVYPDRPESCDGIDNDCDGEIDEGVAGTWYIDADGDGYGAPDQTSTACAAPDGYVSNADDCDDTMSAVYPGAPETDCNDPIDYNCDGSVGFTDADGDGIAACEDCDDADDSTYPGAPEVCDGADNDCDDAIDEDPIDAPTWYIDYDSDTYGSDAYVLVVCDPPSGYVTNADDCNDYDATAHPGGIEVCDGVDNDCNGTIDTSEAEDSFLSYPDNDGDGFGDPDAEIDSCELASGYVEEGGDCDDEDMDINPDAIEICDDGIDNDCVPDFTGCEATIDDIAQSRFIGETSDDRAGISMVNAGDLDNDGSPDLAIGAYQNSAGSEGDEGAVYVYFGPLSAGDMDLADAPIKLAGVGNSDRAGYTLAGVGDFDGDGLDDLMVGASTASDLSASGGSVYLITGQTFGTLSGGDELSLAQADYTWTGESMADWVGTGMSAAGDMNDDGLADLLVGATGDDSSNRAAGVVHLILGDDDLTQGDIVSIDDEAQASIYGDDENDYLGTSALAPGDMDGDGQPDLVLAAYLSGNNGDYAGTVYLQAGPVTGSQAAGDCDALLLGTSAGDRAGAGLAQARDFTGDGRSDIWVGATREDEGAAEAGAIYLLPGDTDLASLTGLTLDDLATVKVVGAQTGHTIGSSMAFADFDGDGTSDLLFSATPAGDDGQGAVFLLYGPLSGTMDTATANLSMFNGDQRNDHVGARLSALGDMLGTGDEVMGVGAWEDDAGGSDAGTAYLLVAPGM